MNLQRKRGGKTSTSVINLTAKTTQNLKNSGTKERTFFDFSFSSESFVCSSSGGGTFVSGSSDGSDMKSGLLLATEADGLI